MKSQLIATTLFVISTGFAHAQSDVFLCVGENGNKEYKNTGTTKGCSKVDLPGITTIPAPAKRPPLQTASAAKVSSSPADYPKVDSGIQKARDSDRKQILLDEKRTEEQKLAELKKEYKNGEPDRKGDERNFAKYQDRVVVLKEDLGRTEKNIEALQREIDNIK
ncbi:hypothetical protein BH11PSE11_BH11PSE11_05840 [soil metagenome]